MYQVGTNTGDAHHQRQGTGLATILPTDNTMLQIALQDRKMQAALRAAEAKQKVKERDDTLAKIKDLNADFYYTHQNEMINKVNENIDSGAKLLADGTDPFSSSTPQATAWRKERAYIMQMSASSKQIQKIAEENQQKLTTEEVDAYDPADIKNFHDYLQIPLDKVVKDKIVPPTIMKRQPFLDAFKEIGTIMSSYTTSLNGQQPSDVELMDFITAAVNDPKNKDRYVQTYTAKFKQMSPSELQGIKDRALANGKEPWQQAAFEDAKRWEKRKGPFDPVKEMSSAADQITQGLDVKGYSTPYAFSEKTSEADAKANVLNMAETMVIGDPRWTDHYQKIHPQLPTETDGQYREKVKVWLAEDLDPMVKRVSKSGTTASGQGRKERVNGQEDWLKNMRSGDEVLMNAASDYLHNVKLANGMVITNSFTKPGVEGVSIELSTPTELKSQEEVQNAADRYGIKVQRWDPVDGKLYGWLGTGATDIENQRMLGIYNEAAEQKKAEYDSKFSEHSPTSVQQREQTGPVVQPVWGGRQNNNHLFD